MDADDGWAHHPPGTQAVSPDGYSWTKWVDGTWRGREGGNFARPGKDATNIIPPRPSNMRPQAALALLGAELTKRTKYQNDLRNSGFDDDEARFRAEWHFSSTIEQMEEDCRLARHQEQASARARERT